MSEPITIEEIVQIEMRMTEAVKNWGPIRLPRHLIEKKRMAVEIRRLRGSHEGAYREGWRDGVERGLQCARGPAMAMPQDSDDWAVSDTKRALDGEKLHEEDSPEGQTLQTSAAKTTNEPGRGVQDPGLNRTGDDSGKASPESPPVGGATNLVSAARRDEEEETLW